MRASGFPISQPSGSCADKFRSPSVRWGLIADDLTGACDAGVQFAQRGFSCMVWLNSESLLNPACELAILTTDSRNDAPRVAWEKVERACHLSRNVQAPTLFKKIDSTLRGNIGVEIESAMLNGGLSLAVVAPAFPSMGRIVVNGWLRVKGTTAAALLHLPTLLREQGVKDVGHLDRSALAFGVDTVRKSLARARAAGERAVVFDTTEPGDLATIAEAAMGLEPRPLLVGSAGLAAELANVLARQWQKPSPSASGIPADMQAVDPVVLIIGSTNAVTEGQVKTLLARSRVVAVRLREAELERAREALKVRSHLLVTLDVRSVNLSTLEQFISMITQFPVQGIVLSGGDTASLVLRVFQTTGIQLEQEAITGIPLGFMVGGLAEGLPVVTKAGGFGDEDALVAVTNILAARRRLPR